MIKRLVIKAIVAVFALASLKTLIEKQYADATVLNKIVTTAQESLQTEEGQENYEMVRDIANGTWENAKLIWSDVKIVLMESKNNEENEETKQERLEENSE